MNTNSLKIFDIEEIQPEFLWKQYDALNQINSKEFILPSPGNPGEGSGVRALVFDNTISSLSDAAPSSPALHLPPSLRAIGDSWVGLAISDSSLFCGWLSDVQSFIADVCDELMNSSIGWNASELIETRLIESDHFSIAGQPDCFRWLDLIRTFSVSLPLPPASNLPNSNSPSTGIKHVQ